MFMLRVKRYTAAAAIKKPQRKSNRVSGSTLQLKLLCRFKL
jgi:hypothetical protein